MRKKAPKKGSFIWCKFNILCQKSQLNFSNTVISIKIKALFRFFFKKFISKQVLNLLHQINEGLGVANENRKNKPFYSVSKRNKSCIDGIDDVDFDVYQLKYLS